MARDVTDYKTRNEYLDDAWEATKHYDRYQGPEGRAVFYDEMIGQPGHERFSHVVDYYNAVDPNASPWLTDAEASLYTTPKPETTTSQPTTTVSRPTTTASRSGTSGLLPSATAPQSMVSEAPYTKSYSDRAHAAITTPRYTGNYSSVPESFMPSWMRGGSAPAPASTGNKGLLPALDREHSSVPEHLMPEWLRGRSSGMSDMIPPEWRGNTSGE